MENGRTAMFSAIGKRGVPWHGLGQQVQDAQTWEQAQKLSGLNWEVEKRPLFGFSDDKYNQVSAYGIFRADNHQFLGSVGDVYTPIQNAQAFDFVDTLLESIDGAHYESAGALGDGSRIWCLARVPYKIQIAGTDDISDNYLLFETSHDGSLSATCKLTSVRVVCQNTLTMALNSAGTALKIRHSSSGTEKLEAAKKMMQGVQQSVESLSEKLNLLAKRKINPELSGKIMEGLFGKDWKDSTRKRNQVEEIARLYAKNDGNAFPETKGTAYNLLNAVTEYSDHYRNVRITDGKQGMTESQVRGESAVFGGTGEAMKTKALSYILETVEFEPEISTPIYSRPYSNRAGVNSIMNMVAVA
jgi:phage/plasmid-related protein TIGR03299